MLAGMKRVVVVLGALILAACQMPPRPDQSAARSPVGAVAEPLLAGEFDNHEQVWRAHENSDAVVPAHALITVEPTSQTEWSLWRIHLDASPALDAVWAMHGDKVAAGQVALVPHRALVAAPGTGAAFDPKQWAPLDACGLHGSADASSLHATADAAACAVIAPGVGTAAALLPLAIDREGEWLHVRLYADQARGADARTDARLVRWFTGWAAINGAGPKAAAESRDWHMDRNVRLGSEGGRFALRWRDGSPAGYSLGLERVTYRDGNVPVLKLSIVDDGSGNTLAYAWANPEATRIGINLGWVQVGLESAPASAPERRH